MEMIKTAVKPAIINALNMLYKLYLKSRTHLESKEISSDIGCQYRKSFGGLNCKMNQILIQDDFFWRENTVTVLALWKVIYFRYFPEIFWDHYSSEKIFKNKMIRNIITGDKHSNLNAHVYVQDFWKMQSDMMFIVLFFNTIDHKVIT